MPHAIDEFYRGVPDHKPLEPQLRIWDEGLEREYPSHDPRKTDGRHPSDGYHRAQITYLDSKGLGHGAGHFGIWHARGQQSHQTSKSNGPYCHILSEDTRGGPHTLPEKVREVRRAAFKKYQLRLIPVEEALGIFYKVLAPEKFAKSREQREFIVAEFTKYGLESLPQLSEYQCHLFMARVKNKSVTNHKDEGDFGLAVETTFGNFAGGDFCCSELNERFYFRAGDFLVMDARVLAHCVAHFDGERTTIVFTSKSSCETRKPHVNYMEDGPEKDAILATKGSRESVRGDLRAAEEARVQHYIDAGFELATDGQFPSWDEWRLTGIPSRPNKLAKATVEKNHEIRAFKKVLPKKDLGELGFMKNLPDSLFYPFTRAEKTRLERERPPFEALKPTTKRDHNTGTSESDTCEE